MADKRKPVIDDSPEPNQHSLDDDFNDLIRRELSDDAPKSSEPKPAPVIEPKVEPKPVKIEPVKKEIKIEPVKKVERPVPAKKVEIEAKKPEPKKAEVKKVEPKVVAVKPQPKKVETRPEPRKVERAKVEPKKVEPRKAEAKSEPIRGAPAYDDEPKGLGKWIAILLVLILAAAAVYAVGALRSGKDASGLECATEYADARGTTLSWSDASSVEQFWLTKAFETKSEAESVEILHMLACESAFISTLSEPAGYSSCPTNDIFVVVDESALSDNPIARLDKDSVLAKLNTESTLVRFTLAYKLTDPNVRAWKIVEPKKK